MLEKHIPSKDKYEAPKLTTFGSVVSLTMGSVGSGVDMQSGQMMMGGGGGGMGMM